MRCRALFCLPLGLLLVSVCRAGQPTNRFEIFLEGNRTRDDRYLGVEKGKLTLGWGSDWYVDGTRIKRVKGWGYLAYDPSGKDKTVFLSPLPWKGTNWSVSEPRREEDRADIRVGSGPLKGWYLCEEGGRAVLRKGPSRKLQVRRVFDHK